MRRPPVPSRWPPALPVGLTSPVCPVAPCAGLCRACLCSAWIASRASAPQLCSWVTCVPSRRSAAGLPQLRLARLDLSQACRKPPRERLSEPQVGEACATAGMHCLSLPSPLELRTASVSSTCSAERGVSCRGPYTGSSSRCGRGRACRRGAVPALSTAARSSATAGVRPAGGRTRQPP